MCISPVVVCVHCRWVTGGTVAETRSWELVACIGLCILYIPLFALYVPGFCFTSLVGFCLLTSSFAFPPARYVCVVKSVPEQVWYDKALPVGDGGQDGEPQLRTLGNHIALASPRLLTAGRTRSRRVVPVDESGAPVGTNKKKRWCVCLCSSNGDGDSVTSNTALHTTTVAADAASDVDDLDAAGMAMMPNALASSDVEHYERVAVGEGALSRVVVEKSSDGGESEAGVGGTVQRHGLMLSLSAAEGASAGAGAGAGASAGAR